MTRNIKIFLGLLYILCLGLILYGFFVYVDVFQLNNYSYIRDKTQFLAEFRDRNFIVFSLVFMIFTIIWILLLGFASPIALVSGFLFGKFFGTLISVLGFTLGCTLLYIFANQFFKNFILEKLSKKIHKFKKLFNKNELFYFMVFRFAGGGGVPFAIQNLLPVIFNMKVKNYFFSTLLGLFPLVFIFNAIGSGLENIIQTTSNPSLFSILQTREIYLPIIGFFLVIILSFILRYRYFKK